MRCIHLLYEQSERETEIDGEAGKEILNLVKESSRDQPPIATRKVSGFPLTNTSSEWTVY